MIKQVLITSIAAAGLLLSAQASAHNSSGGSVVIWNNSAHGHSHQHNTQPVPRPAPKPLYRVNREQRQQATMIQQGIKTCRITPSEAATLKEQQHRINKAERRMRKDGLQHWERMKLKKRLHKARVQINRLSQNNKRCNRGNGHHNGHGGNNKPHYNHSHGNNHHSHSNGNHFHSHSNWSFSNDRGSFSIGIAQ